MKKNVLLVDDDSIFNFLSKKTLEGMGITNEIHTALNGKEAIDLFNGYSMGSVSLPDLIFLDLNMPIMDGFQFIELFRRLDLPNKEKVEIVIVTSSQDPRDIEKAKALGIKHVLLKPVTEASIKSVLV